MNIPIAEHVKLAERLAARNKGKLPRLKLLLKQNPRLYSSLFRRPDLFAHIERERPVQDWATRAKEVAAKHGGLLPCYSDLLKIDKTLASATMRKPELFQKLPRAARTKSRQKLLDKAVRQLERIAAKHGGKYELTQAFIAKYPAINMQVRHHPEAFKHLKRITRKTRTPEQWVAYADRLARKNGGLLPSQLTLRDKYPGLVTAMRRDKDRFKHLISARTLLTLQDHVNHAESYLREHGELPMAGWLERNGNRKLATAMYRYPEAFEALRRKSDRLAKARKATR